MALKYLTHIDLNKNQLQNAVIHPLGTAPSGPVEGQIYYDSTVGDKKVYIYNGTAWTNISGDISAVVAGNALTGGGTDGSVTLNVAVDDTTIAIASDALKVKDGGIGSTQLAATSVTAGAYELKKGLGWTLVRLLDARNSCSLKRACAMDSDASRHTA